MAPTRRDAVRALAAVSALPALRALHALAEQSAHRTPGDLAGDQDYWDQIRRAYDITPDFIQLENGYFSPCARDVHERYLAHLRMVNARSSHYMRTQQVDDKHAARRALAAAFGCDEAELIITRNTTESLDTVISGFDWRAGDEAVMAEQDYGAMLDHFALMERRHGLVRRVISLPMDPSSDDEIVAAYERAITPRTRLLMVCHLVNITGQVLPVRAITAMAHRHGVQVLVDGAHAFAHLDFTRADLGPIDYYGTSLHKWLGTPLGAGFLYVRRDRIAPLWPLFGDRGFADDDIAKLNHTGTHPVATDLAITDALAFHDAIGLARKGARLRWLQRYWTTRVRDLPGIVFNTPREESRTAAIANVGVLGIAPGELARRLLADHGIFTVAIDGAGVHGVRVTPHLFTTTAELDRLVDALTRIAHA
ncbi:MAG: aminotransferase class V-fold PLP-dependent enzyme [Gemmatimonadaceae bacterium]|nr:aminotransferase class V-fold PLP-dependent enzyme [Gemmatimonadaceae bacterium]